MQEPTQRQLQIKDFIATYIEMNKRGPTAAEIQRHFHLRSKATVLKHLTGMQKKKMIHRIAFRKTSVEISIEAPKNVDHCPHCHYPIKSN